MTVAAAGRSLARCRPGSESRRRLRSRYHPFVPLGLGIWEIVILVAILALLFGTKGVPKMARRLGTGLREVRSAVDDVDPRKMLEAPAEKPRQAPAAKPRTAPAEQPRAAQPQPPPAEPPASS